VDVKSSNNLEEGKGRGKNEKDGFEGAFSTSSEIYCVQEVPPASGTRKRVDAKVYCYINNMQRCLLHVKFKGASFSKTLLSKALISFTIRKFAVDLTSHVRFLGASLPLDRETSSQCLLILGAAIILQKLTFTLQTSIKK
jgi:hypothetical protein